MILGGIESDGKESKIVEEIDFIKRNLVSLPPLKQGRVQPSAFMVNDAIYVFGGAVNQSTANEMILGEKFALRENRWRDVVSRHAESHAAKNAVVNLVPPQVIGPASLLFE
jgi:hypothetical protein